MGPRRPLPPVVTEPAAAHRGCCPRAPPVREQLGRQLGPVRWRAPRSRPCGQFTGRRRRRPRTGPRAGEHRRCRDQGVGGDDAAARRGGRERGGQRDRWGPREREQARPRRFPGRPAEPRGPRCGAAGPAGGRAATTSPARRPGACKSSFAGQHATRSRYDGACSASGPWFSRLRRVPGCPRTRRSPGPPTAAAQRGDRPGRPWAIRLARVRGAR